MTAPHVGHCGDMLVGWDICMQMLVTGWPHGVTLPAWECAWPSSSCACKTRPTGEGVHDHPATAGDCPSCAECPPATPTVLRISTAAWQAQRLDFTSSSSAAILLALQGYSSRRRAGVCSDLLVPQGT